MSKRELIADTTDANQISGPEVTYNTPEDVAATHLGSGPEVTYNTPEDVTAAHPGSGPEETEEINLSEKLENVCHMSEQASNTGDGSETEVPTLKVDFDMRLFCLEDVSLKIMDKYVVVEGIHEEHKDGHRYISHQFVWRSLLPENMKNKALELNLSHEGVLTIAVPKKYDTVITSNNANETTENAGLLANVNTVVPTLDLLSTNQSVSTTFKAIDSTGNNSNEESLDFQPPAERYLMQWKIPHEATSIEDSSNEKPIMISGTFSEEIMNIVRNISPEDKIIFTMHEIMNCSEDDPVYIVEYTGLAEYARWANTDNHFYTTHRGLRHDLQNVPLNRITEEMIMKDIYEMVTAGVPGITKVPDSHVILRCKDVATVESLGIKFNSLASEEWLQNLRISTEIPLAKRYCSNGNTVTRMPPNGFPLHIW